MNCSPLPWTEEDPPAATDIAVVGGGFAGLATAAHVRTRWPAARIAIFERRPLRRPGVAYGACHSAHLLNVAAGRMGAWPEAPDEFLRWVREQTGGSPSSHDFVPRRLYGDYLNWVLRQRLVSEDRRVRFLRREVLGLDDAPDGGCIVRLAEDGRIRARAAVLALGLPPALPPWFGRVSGVEPGVLIDDPWRPEALDVPSEEHVVLVGSGLTAIDVVIALRRGGHRGRITAISRSGRWPLPHGSSEDPPCELPQALVGLSPQSISSILRRAARSRADEGRGWQAVLDAVRPHVAAVWRSWSASERRRFLRHLRPFWEIHRHRAPVSVLAELADLEATGTLRLTRGEIGSVMGGPDGTIHVASTGSGAARATLVAHRIVNCCGPLMRIGDSTDPFMQSLLAGGRVAPDEMGLGLRADATGRAVDSIGASTRNIWIVGALRRGEVWESTAVPELRAQALAAAEAIVTRVHGLIPAEETHHAAL